MTSILFKLVSADVAAMLIFNMRFFFFNAPYLLVKASAPYLLIVIIL